MHLQSWILPLFWPHTVFAIATTLTPNEIIDAGKNTIASTSKTLKTGPKLCKYLSSQLVLYAETIGLSNKQRILARSYLVNRTWHDLSIKARSTYRTTAGLLVSTCRQDLDKLCREPLGEGRTYDLSCELQRCNGEMATQNTPIAKLEK
ncbi:uncharacterized protein FMAN_02064 [Fusarium mangiferae]|uniref:Uncharacterized protein n=1 Tax=Fusarium mangiferae TaxID=192010 RepID=A0A1L7SQH3_FUSMA|nr:uncharacterized protein FMAN_02064 [Fusarium mangiferae]CVK85158.1 uncharacterized protein FMAN_02064 [Fusarium mangiferae]